VPRMIDEKFRDQLNALGDVDNAVIDRRTPK
jgi:hypothetical protein